MRAFHSADGNWSKSFFTSSETCSRCHCPIHKLNKILKTCFSFNTYRSRKGSFLFLNAPNEPSSQFLQFEHYPFYQQQQQQQQQRKSAIWAGNKKARLVNAAFIQNCCLQLFMANLRLLSGCRLPDPLRIKASFAQAISLEGWGVRWASREVIHGQKQNSNGGKVWTFPYRSMTLRPYGSC